jgi:hypothetical protein
MKRAIDDDIDDYFRMQERKTAKGRPAAPTPPPPTVEVEKIDITVEELAWIRSSRRSGASGTDRSR